MFTAGCNGSVPDMSKYYNIVLHKAFGRRQDRPMDSRSSTYSMRCPIICVLCKAPALASESSVIPECYESLRASRDFPPR